MRAPEQSQESCEIAADGDDESISDAALQTYIRRNLVLTVVILVLLFGMLASLGAWYDKELHEGATAIFDTLGIAGLALLIFAADSITSPIPPDLALIVIANSPLASNWHWPVLFLGVVSTIAGCVGWWIGGHLGQARFVKLVLRRMLKPSHLALIRRYGRAGVMLGALTPVPFSITCWLAGMVGMRFRQFLPASALRIPRVIGYYLIIAESSRLFAP